MVIKLTVHKVGDQLGVILPQEALAILKAGEGDSICLSDGADGLLRISSADSDHAEQMAKAEEIIERYPETFRRLAQ